MGRNTMSAGFSTSSSLNLLFGVSMRQFHSSILIALVLPVVLSSCSSDNKPAKQEEINSQAVSEIADIVLTNAYVYTVDNHQSIKQAVAIKGNEIIYVGGEQNIDQYIDDRTDVRDLGGRMLMPGIYDSHIHAAGIADLDICDMRGEGFTLEEMAVFVRACIEKYQVPEGEWLIVSQWAFSYGNQPSKNVPTLRAALDAASTKHPIMLAGNDGHHNAVNSAALAKAKDKQGTVVGINKETLKTIFADYRELIGVDEAGEPNGGISEVARFLVKEDYMKEYQYLFKPAEVMMPLVAEKLAKNGITSILEAYVDSYLLDYYLWLSEAGKMTFRMRAALVTEVKDSLSKDAYKQIPNLVKQLQAMRKKTEHIPNFEGNAVKLLVDGVLEGNPYAVPPTLPVAAILGEFKQPIFSINEETDVVELRGYVDLDSGECEAVRSKSEQYSKVNFIKEFTDKYDYHPGQCKKGSGVLEYNETFITEFIRQTTEAGFHVHIHALSDKGVRLTMDAFEAVKETADSLGLSQSITHAQLVHPDDVIRLGELGVYVAFTYVWADPDTEYDMSVIPFINEIAGKSDLYNPDHYYVKNAYPVKSIKDAGGILTWGSDAPVEVRDPRPFENMQIAVTRAAEGKILNADERISIHDAIAAFTINGAQYLGQKDKLGSIEAGKTADIIVLSQNVVKLAEQGEAEKIGETLVDLTIFDGKIIHEREQSSLASIDKQ